MAKPADLLVLPWPARALHPNARPHWTVLRRAAREARHHAHLVTLEAGWHLVELPEGRLLLWLTFYPPNLSRKRDDDGLVASMKPARDGIADALGIDDHRFRCMPHIADEAFPPDGRVEVRISAAPPMPSVVPLMQFGPKKPKRNAR